MLKNKNLTTIIVVVLALAVAVLAAVLIKQQSPRTEEVSMLYVVRGEATVEGNTLSVNPDLVEWFTNSPYREAGQITASEIVSLWSDSFKTSPPNAAIIGNQVDAAVELSTAALVNENINFSYQVIDGQLQDTELGMVSIFIDLNKIPFNSTNKGS